MSALRSSCWRRGGAPQSCARAPSTSLSCMTANASARAPLPSLSRCRRPSRASRAKSASKNIPQFRDGSSGLRQIEQMTALGILYLDDPGIGIEVDLALEPPLHGLLLHRLRDGGHEGPVGGRP